MTTIRAKCTSLDFLMTSSSFGWISVANRAFIRCNRCRVSGSCLIGIVRLSACGTGASHVQLGSTAGYSWCGITTQYCGFVKYGFTRSYVNTDANPFFLHLSFRASASRLLTAWIVAQRRVGSPRRRGFLRPGSRCAGGHDLREAHRAACGRRSVRVRCGGSFLFIPTASRARPACPQSLRGPRPAVPRRRPDASRLNDSSTELSRRRWRSMIVVSKVRVRSFGTCRGAPHCARSAAHCTAGPPRPPAGHSTSPPRSLARPG